MPTYTVTFTDPEATYPAPHQHQEVHCGPTEIWTEATKLGYVTRIYQNGSMTVYSEAWSFNFIDVTKQQIDVHYFGNR